MIAALFGTAKQLIFSPSAFYRDMAKTGGYAQPTRFLIFVAALCVLLSVLSTAFSVSMAAAFSELLINIVVFPISIVVGAYVIGFGFYLLWRLLGSAENFETAFRCVAYAAIMLPIIAIAQQFWTVILTIALLWLAWILTAASEQVHGLSKIRSGIVMIILAALVFWRLSCGCCAEGDSGEHAVVAPITEDNTDEQVENQASTDSQSIIEAASKDLIGSVTEQVESVEQKIEQSASDFTDSVSQLVDDIEGKLSSDKEAVMPVAEADTANKTDDSIQADTASSAESAGAALGKMVKEVSESVVEMQESFVEAFSDDSNSGDAEAKSSQNKPETFEQVSSEENITPEALGKLLGQFIRQINEAAEMANRGFEEGVAGEQAEADSDNVANKTAENAGRALGDFIRGFNEAVEGLELAPNESNGG